MPNSTTNNQQTNSTTVNDPVNQTNQTNNTPVFDVNNLPPEFVSYVDQQRTQASQTARANARKELMKDDTFLSEIRDSMQPGVQKSVEDQLAEIRRETMMDRSATKVEKILSHAGISEEAMSTYLPLLTSENVEESVEKATAFVSTLNKTVESAISAKEVNAMQSMPTPQNAGNPVTDAERLQSKFDALKTSTNRNRGVEMSAIIREAQEKGIVLK